jgi:hypothetical protein
MIRVQLAKEGTQDRRLSRSHRSRQGNEADAIVNAVKEVCKRFPVAPAHEEKTGVRGQTKRLFPETMKVEVHHPLSLGRQVFRKFHPKGRRIFTFILAEIGKKSRDKSTFPQVICLFKIAHPMERVNHIFGL